MPTTNTAQPRGWEYLDDTSNDTSHADHPPHTTPHKAVNYVPPNDRAHAETGPPQDDGSIVTTWSCESSDPQNEPHFVDTLTPAITHPMQGCIRLGCWNANNGVRYNMESTVNYAVEGNFAILSIQEPTAQTANIQPRERISYENAAAKGDYHLSTSKHQFVLTHNRLYDRATCLPTILHEGRVIHQTFRINKTTNLLIIHTYGISNESSTNVGAIVERNKLRRKILVDLRICLLYTSDAADE